MDRPGLTSVRGSKHAGDRRPSGSKPGVPIAFYDQTGATGRERSLALECRGMWSGGDFFQLRPPSSVVKIVNRPSTASPMAIP